MTELSFLIDLLLNHKLPKATKDAVAARIREVEARASAAPPPQAPPAFGVRPVAAPAAIPAHMVGQPASTIAAMLRQEAAGTVPVGIQSNPVVTQDPGAASPPPPPQPVAVVAQTPMAAAAMAERQAAIAQAVSGKPEKGRTSPRKF